ncbi:MAG TPA: oligosaccharide flippase family protein [Phenylobacterium sp.]|uniref:oligosaccharide flippase family protein n=1 Tax=Phenylobacterium sp. TaxID=1871053 RepID=UPI002BD285A6|nr:oligosaccharide flippase family protein [Phenylobacterium sp.]HSV03168.1 oligosaccharide flippase family protein [Phenylobacterium sp.]
MDRLLLKNLGLYGAYYGFRFLFPLIVTPFLAHVLARGAFADFAIINSCVWTSSVFMEFGFYLYGVAKTAAAADDKAELGAVVSSIAMSKLLLSPMAAAVYLGLTLWTGVLGREPTASLVGLVSALGYGASFAWYFQGRQRGLFAVLNEAIPQAVQFSLLLLFVRSPSQLWLVFVLQAIPPLSSLSVALLTVRLEGLLHLPSLATVRQALGKASPYFVERFCFSTYTSIVPSLVAVLSTKAAVADYSVGDRFATVVVSLVGPLTQAAMPRVARAVRTPEGGWGLSIRLVAVLVSVTIVLALALGLAANVIIHMFFSKDFAGAVTVARIFCLSAVFSSLSYGVANFVLIPRDHVRVMFWSSAMALVLGLSAQLVLAPLWGATGAAIGRLVAEVTVATVLLTTAAPFFRRREGRPDGRVEAEIDPAASLAEP